MQSQTLTPEMREYLGQRDVEFFFDFVANFQREFTLQPQHAARLISQWIVETMPHLEGPQ